LQPGAVVQLGIGWPRDHLYIMAQLAEGMGEVAYVDALAAAMGMAAVAEQPDAKGPIIQSIRHWCINPLAFFEWLQLSALMSVVKP
jgi:hypothetical protein